MFIGLGGGFFALEKLYSLLDQAQKNLGADLHLVRGDHRFVYSGHQQLVADFFGQRAFIGLEKAALSGDGFDDAQAFQLGVSFGDGVAIDAQFLGQRTNGGKRVARAQAAGSSGIADLIHQLEINRFAGLKINAKHHCLPSYDSGTVGQLRKDVKGEILLLILRASCKNG